jgi:hypothetical protein
MDKKEEILSMACAIIILRIVLMVVLCYFLGFPAPPSVEVLNNGEVMGFWYGLWHGWISIVSFIFSLWDDTVGIYAINNNGIWYNFGFLLGCSPIIERLLSGGKN